MTKEEIIEELKKLNVSFNQRAKAEDLQALLDAENERLALEKLVEDEKGFLFGSDAFKKKIKEAKEREFPDYGRDVPEGVYTFSGGGTYKVWHSPKTDSDVQILVAFLLDDAGKKYEVAAAAFAATEYNFVSYDGKDSKGSIRYKKVDMSPILPFVSSTADRNGLMSTIPAGSKVVVKHSPKGHFDNPYNQKIWDFVRTWVEYPSDSE